MNNPIAPNPNAAPLGILLIDDEPAMLSGLELLIDGEAPRMSVIGKASNARTALQLAELLRPDVIVLDLDLGGDSGIDFLPKLLPWCRGHVVILTGAKDAALHERAIRTGAAIVVSKEDGASTLLHALCWKAGAEGQAHANLRANASAPSATSAELSGHRTGECGLA